MSGITPQSPLIGIYAVPPYAREVTLVWPSGLGAGILVILGYRGVILAQHAFASSVFPANIIGRDFVGLPDGARWWGVTMVPFAADPPILQRDDRVRAVWRLHV